MIGTLRSTSGRLALTLAAALLLAQGINLKLLLDSRERLRQSQMETTISQIVGRFARMADISDRLPSGPPRRRDTRWMFERTSEPKAAELEIDQRLTAAVKSALAETGLEEGGAVAAMSDFVGRNGRRVPSMVLSLPEADGGFLNVQIPRPPDQQVPYGPLFVQTILIYLLLLGGTLVVTHHLSRPLNRLTAAANRVGETAGQGATTNVRVEEEGPEDVRILIASFNDMNERIAALFREKDVMLGAIGHDLRTPLTSMRIRAESIENDKLRDGIIASIESMVTQIDDILELARLGSPRGEMERIALPTLFRALQEDYPHAEERLQVSSPPGVEVSCYPTALRRALSNLIDNALQHADVVTLSATMDEDQVALSVSDDGPGVPADLLPTLKVAFQRGEDSRSRDTGGAGLGLTIAEGIARLHGGRLDLANKEGSKGFVATLILPAAHGAERG